MKALRQTISLTKGLAPSNNIPPNQPWLKQASGVRMSAAGLELEPTPTYPLSLTVSWPWPQMVNLSREVVVIQSDGLYVAASDWSLTQILSLSVADSTVLQFVDFIDYWLVLDGSSMYQRDVEGGTIAEHSDDAVPSLATMVDYNGQLVGGNVSGSWYDCDSEYAVWSNIGSFSFVPNERNEAGYRHMGIGTIWRCLTLGDAGVVFYGSEGVAMLVPAGNTFKYRKISKAPPYGEGAMGGDEVQYYINSEGNLVKLSKDGQELLGYKWLMTELDSTLVRFFQDDVRGDVYITDGTRSFILANGQLTEGARIPTSLCVIDGSLVGPFVAGSGQVTIQLWKADFNVVAMKSLEFMELGVQTDGSITGSTDFYYQLGEVAYSLGWRAVNESGFVYLSATANLFEPLIQVTGMTSLKLAYVTLGVKLSDNRIQNQLQTMSDGSWNAG